jgi:hypothetical protein
MAIARGESYTHKRESYNGNRNILFGGCHGSVFDFITQRYVFYFRLNTTRIA